VFPSFDSLLLLDEFVPPEAFDCEPRGGLAKAKADDEEIILANNKRITTLEERFPGSVFVFPDGRAKAES